MKVYMVLSLPFPHGKASTKRIQCYAKAVISQGLDCEILLYSRWESKKHHYNNVLGIGIFEGIPFKYISHNSFRSSNRFISRFYDFLDKCRLIIYLLRILKKGDVVYGFSSDILSFQPLVRIVSHFKNAYYVGELCELPYITGKKNFFMKIKRWLTFHTQFPFYDGIISISETLLSLAKQYTSQKCKHIKIPILVDYEKYAIQEKSDQAEFFYIFHAGTLTEQKDGFVGMVEAICKANLLLNKNVYLISTGYLSQSSNSVAIKNLIEKYNLENNIIFKGFLSDEELKDLLSKASLVIINKYETLQNYYCFSTKLAEYLAASKPVIITDVGESRNWLTHGKNAYIIKPHNNNELVDAIVHLYKDKDLRLLLSKQGNLLCRESFHYSVYSKVLTDYFTAFSL